MRRLSLSSDLTLVSPGALSDLSRLQDITITGSNASTVENFFATLDLQDSVVNSLVRNLGTVNITGTVDLGLPGRGYQQVGPAQTVTRLNNASLTVQGGIDIQTGTLTGTGTIRTIASDIVLLLLVEGSLPERPGSTRPSRFRSVARPRSAGC